MRRTPFSLAFLFDASALFGPRLFTKVVMVIVYNIFSTRAELQAVTSQLRTHAQFDCLAVLLSGYEQHESYDAKHPCDAIG